MRAFSCGWSKIYPPTEDAPLEAPPQRGPRRVLPVPTLCGLPVLFLDSVPQGSDLRDELSEGVRPWQCIAIGRAPVPPERLPAREAQERSQ